jgi:hypothetical protein
MESPDRKTSKDSDPDSDTDAGRGPDSGVGLKQSPVHHRLAFFAIGTLILFVIVTLPFSLTSAFNDVLGSPESRVYELPVGSSLPRDENHSHVRMLISSLDELEQAINIRISIRRDFFWKEKYKERILLFSVVGGDNSEEIPASVCVDFPSDEYCSHQSVQLPVRGQPLRYPFDEYEMNLGIVIQQIYPDGNIKNMRYDEVKDSLLLQLAERLPRQDMLKPVNIDPATREGPSISSKYMLIEKIVMKRPNYLKVLSILLVLLVAAAAAYAVFLRPLSELIVNSGALVLGVWGIRSILVSGSSSFVNAVDISLSIIILFLLLAISIKTLLYFKEESRLDLPGWKCRSGNTCSENDKESQV